MKTKENSLLNTIFGGFFTVDIKPTISILCSSHLYALDNSQKINDILYNINLMTQKYPSFEVSC